MGERLSARAGLGTAEVVLILAGLCGECLVQSPPCAGCSLCFQKHHVGLLLLFISVQLNYRYKVLV